MKATDAGTQAVPERWRQFDGTLTHELQLVPGNFGLGKVPSRLAPEATTSMVCGYCSTGCSLKIHFKDGEPVNLSPTTEYPVNLGMACPKGWEALEPLRAKDRATVPLLRSIEGEMQPVSWQKAMETFTRRFKALIEQHGPESVAWIGTGQICTEELAYLGAFAKFGMGMIHGDGNTRQCMATSVVAYKQAFGFDAPPFTYADLESSDVLVFLGSNLTIAHPILWQRVLRNPNHPEIIVIDPRKTETAMAATQHYALKPKSDLVLLYGLANLLIQRDWIDANYIINHTEGYEAFREHVRTFTPDFVCSTTGLSVAELFRLAQTIHQGKRVSFWWTMGVNQGHEAVRTAQAIINLALITGNMGRPGTGANSITGQCNAMGSRLFSNTTNLLGGHDFTRPEDRNKIADLLSIPVERIPSVNSWAYDQIVEGIHAGKIKGLWLIATNPAHSWIYQPGFLEAANKLEFLVVQDMYYSTETAIHADLLLPAAGWGEKEGTFINSERRIGLVKKVARAPGQALSDFNIFRLAAEAWGVGELFREWSTPEKVFQIMKRVSRGQPCDITGICDYAMLEKAGGVQWPFPERIQADGENGKPAGNHFGMSQSNLAPASTHLSGAGETMHRDLPPIGESGRECSVTSDSATASPTADPALEYLLANPERRLFEDGHYFTSTGRARFCFESPRLMPEGPDESYPLILLTGRGTSAQWHTQTRTGKSEILTQLHPKSVYVEVHPDDARRLHLHANDLAVISSRRGTIEASVFISSTVNPGQVFIPMHYAETNRLTHSSFDPYSRQPNYKCCAVRIQPGIQAHE